MITRRRVSLGGAQLDEIDERIIIQGIEPQAGKETINTVALWGADGSRVTGQHREYLDVKITFSLDMKRDEYAERSGILDQIMGWAAGGGMLRLSTKPDRRLRVICAQLPAEGDALAWTAQYTIVLRAYGIPYWQDESASLLRVNDTAGTTVSYDVPGNTETAMEADFTNTSGARIDTFSLTAGKKKIVLAGMGLKNRETLHIDHNDNGKRCVLRIRISDRNGEYRSILGSRDSSSSDDLTVSPGVNSIQMTAGGIGDLTLSCRGRYV